MHPLPNALPDETLKAFIDTLHSIAFQADGRGAGLDALIADGLRRGPVPAALRDVCAAVRAAGWTRDEAALLQETFVRVVGALLGLPLLPQIVAGKPASAEGRGQTGIDRSGMTRIYPEVAYRGFVDGV